MKKLLGLVLLLGASTSWSAPVTWTLDGVVLANQLPDSSYEYSNLTGSFAYDADTNAFSDISIHSEPGNYFGGATDYTDDAYTAWKPSAIESPSSTSVIFNAFSQAAALCPDICDMVLTLNFAVALTNAGGNIALSGNEAIVGQSWGLVTSRGIVSGSINAVPVPAAVWLFGSALAGLGWMRRKQSA